MAVVLNNLEERVGKAVAHYWNTLEGQGSKQKKGTDNGGRSRVTGGKQMDGFANLIREILVENGMAHASIHLDQRLEIPGYFRPTKKWDILVIHEGKLIAAMECKSQAGPSFGNNLNNRTEEAIGTAQDIRTAFREGAFGKAQDPWLGWIMLLEDCPESRRVVRINEPHFKVFEEFRGTSYARRYEIMIRKLVRERLYTRAAFLLSPCGAKNKADYTEPAEDLNVRGFFASLAGHIGTIVASQS